MPTQNDAVRLLAERIASDVGSRMPYKGAVEVAERIIRDAIRPLLASATTQGLEAVCNYYCLYDEDAHAIEHGDECKAYRDELARWKETGR